MTRLTFLITILLVVVSFGCGLFRQLKSGEVTGTWILTDASRQYLANASRGGVSMIALKPGGSFTATEIPGQLLYGPPDAPPPWQRGWSPLVSGTGVWELTSAEGRQKVELEFREITLGQLGELPHGTELGIYTSGSAPVLYYFLGDPDSARRIWFEKKKEGKE